MIEKLKEYLKQALDFLMTDAIELHIKTKRSEEKTRIVKIKIAFLVFIVLLTLFVVYH